MDGESSAVEAVSSAVPQCIVHGPLRVLIFINDLPESITSSELFSDDCLVYRTILSINDAIQLKQDLHQLGLWVSDRQMTLSPHTCFTMHISNKRKTVCAKYTSNHIAIVASLELNIVVHPTALRCPGERKLTIFVQKH